MRLASVLIFSILSVTAYAAPNAMFVEPKDIKWMDVAGAQGLQTATIEGNAEKGAHHAFMKFAPGFSAPLHHHTPDHFVTVVSGTLILTVDGQERKLPAGSFFSLKKKQAHATACATGEECVLFIDSRGKWDVVPAKK